MTWLPLLLAATAGSLPALSARGVTRQLLAIQDAALSGLVFNEELLFDNDAASKLKCARECLGAGGCVAFTFTEMTSTSSAGCRGHRSSMSSQYSNTMRAETMLHYVSEKSSEWQEICLFGRGRVFCLFNVLRYHRLNVIIKNDKIYRPVN